MKPKTIKFCSGCGKDISDRAPQTKLCHDCAEKSSRNSKDKYKDTLLGR